MTGVVSELPWVDITDQKIDREVIFYYSNCKKVEMDFNGDNQRSLYNNGRGIVRVLG